MNTGLKMDQVALGAKAVETVVLVIMAAATTAVAMVVDVHQVVAVKVPIWTNSFAKARNNCAF